MKKIAFVLVCAIMLAAGGYWATGLFTQANPMAGASDSPAMQLKMKHGKGKDKKGIYGAKEWLYQIRANQNTGIVSIVDILNARNQWIAAKQTKANGGRSLGLTWEELGPDNVGGRTRGLVIDPNEPNKMWCGGVAGGLFYSVDGGLNWRIHPWTMENDHIGISTMRIAPNGDIYIGTGEGFAPVLDGVPNTFGAPGFIGNGLYRSTDGGETFNHIPATAPTPNRNNERWSFVYEIAFDPFDSNKFYVATHKGLAMTTDGGNTFIDAPITPSALHNNVCFEVATDLSNGTVYTILSGRAYRSTDAGITFTEFTGTVGPTANGFPVQSRIGRTELATIASRPGLVYACIARTGFGGELEGVYRSTDFGATWSTVVQGSTNGFNPLGQQGSWNIAFGIDPANPERLILGGQLELWSINVNGGRDLIAYWQPESPSNPYYVHADMHLVEFHPTNPNIMFIGGDGGVYKSTDAQKQFPKFTPRNKGLNITQFYGFGTSFNGYVLGGTQDNGTNYNDCRNNAPMSYREVNGGDGGDGAISRLYPNISFATVYSGRLQRSVNGAQSYGCALGGFLDTNSDCEPDQGALFLAPFALWEFDTVVENTIYKKIVRYDTSLDSVISIDYTPTTRNIRLEKGILFLCTNNGLWFAPNALNPSLSPTWYNVPVAGMATAVSISERGTVFVGTQSGNLYRVDGLADGYVLDSQLVNVITTTDTANPNIQLIDSVFTYYYESPVDRNQWNFPAAGTANATHQGIRRVNITLPGTNGRYVTGVGINPSNENQVVVTYGNYGNSNYVYQSLNGNDPPIGQTSPLPTFESIQNNLPLMPVYDAVFDFYNGNNLILGTELGVWSTANALDGSTNVSWATENSQTFGAVPTFQVRMDPMYDMDCRILYAGTHGRGIFRTTSLTPTQCDVTPCKDIVGINKPIAKATNPSIKVYPNPVSGIANFELNIINGRDAVVYVYDITGRLVFSEKVNSLVSGINKITLDLQQLQSGTYIVAAMVPGEKVATTKLIKQ